MDTTIPLVMLSPSRGEALAEMLRANGIDAVTAATQRTVQDHDYVLVQVPQDKTVLAVKLLESALSIPVREAPSRDGQILIPVDLTRNSITGCRVGLELAERLGTGAILLNAYVSMPMQPDSGLADMTVEEGEIDVENMELEKIRVKALKKYADKIAALQRRGELPDVPLRSMSRAGLPEVVIRDLSRSLRPQVIVMSTRNRHHKAEDLVGSVTAEVLDSCSAPLLTVPEDYDFPGIRAIKRLVFFCNLDGQDAISMEVFLKIFEYPECSITLVPVNMKYGTSTHGKLESMRRLFADCYPLVTFGVKRFDVRDFKKEILRFLEDEGVELLIVQNKKKNIFARLLNPGIAHVLFYERDMPMLVLPV